MTFVPVPSGSSNTYDSPPAYANQAAFPASPTDGQTAIALDDHHLYVYDAGTTAWLIDSRAQTALGTSANDGQSSTLTMASGDCYELTILVGTERACIRISAGYAGAVVTTLSDISALSLPTDAGTGIYVSKSANSAGITIKNRMGGARVITVTAIGCRVSSATAWS